MIVIKICSFFYRFHKKQRIIKKKTEGKNSVLRKFFENKKTVDKQDSFS